AGARRDVNELTALLETLHGVNGKNAARWQLAGMIGLAEGMGRRGTQLGVYLEKLPDAKRQAAEFGLALLADAGKLAINPQRELPDREAAVRLLAHAPWKTAEPALTQLLTGD